VKTVLSIAFVALGAVSLSASGAHADNAKGACNQIVANAMNTAQQCWRGDCGPTERVEVAQTLFSFFEAPGCGEAFGAGEIEGLPGNASVHPNGPDAGLPKHIQEVICNAVVVCNFCVPAVNLGVCGQICP
jgi:hypothetical protein